MKWFRRKPDQPPPAKANTTRIAVLEHDLLGIAPEPGTAAALAIALRRTGTCLKHQPVEVTALADRRKNAICTGCGAAMVETEGGWALA